MIDVKTQALKTKDAATFLGVSARTIRSLADAKRITPIKLSSRQTVYAVSELEAILNNTERG